MISTLKGKIKSIDGQSLILDVSGIGFAILSPENTCFLIDENVELQIYFHFTQEAGPQLFGFKNKICKDVFSLILTVSGIGPKLGLSILSQISPESFIQVVILEDTKALSSLNGIGPKKAELIVMYLKEKIKKINIPEATIEGATVIKLKEISDALSSLHYSRQEITNAIDYVKSNSYLEKPFDEILRKALAYLSK